MRFFDQGADRCRLGLDAGRVGHHVDCLSHSSDLERDVDRQRYTGIQFVLAGLEFLEALTLHGHGVKPGRKIGDGKSSAVGGNRLALDAGGFIVNVDFCAGNRGAGRVLDHTGNRGQIGLGEERKTDKSREQRSRGESFAHHGASLLT